MGYYFYHLNRGASAVLKATATNPEYLAVKYNWSPFHEVVGVTVQPPLSRLAEEGEPYVYL